MEANADVWMGWTWWAAGPKWRNYLFTADPTNLGRQTQADRAVMGVIQPHFVVPSPELLGDYNNNSSVDAGDYTVWRDTLSSTIDLRANGDNTGASASVIDLADYTFWKNHFGQSGSGSGAGANAAVPEPATLLILLVGFLTMCSRRRTAAS
jgi:hypothetical protein